MYCRSDNSSTVLGSGRGCGDRMVSVCRSISTAVLKTTTHLLTDLVVRCFNKCPHPIQQMLLTHTQTRRGCSAAHGRRGRPRMTRTARDALASATATLAPASSARPRPACPKACTSPVEKAPPPYRNRYKTCFFVFQKSLTI